LIYGIKVQLGKMKIFIDAFFHV